MFERRAVLIERCDTYQRQSEFWQNRATQLEGKLESERERNKRREEYLLNLVLIKNNIAPIPDETPTPEKPNPEPTSLHDFKNSIFREWANEAGVSSYEANVAWEMHKDAYAQELGD